MKFWTKKELKTIRNTSLSHRQAADATGRTYASVKAKRRQLGVMVKVYDIDYYSDAEIQYIENNRHLSNPELSKLMGRTAQGLALKRQKLGLAPPNNAWTDKEIKYLLKHYANKEKKEMASYLNRPTTAVISKAYELGITRRTDYWKAEELNILLENIHLPNKEIVKLFDNKSIEQISYKKAYVRARLLKNKKPNKKVKGKIKKDIPYKFRTKLSSYIEYLKHMAVGDSFKYPAGENTTVNVAMKNFPERLFRTTKLSEGRIAWRLR
jgi:hypothetical protein